MKATVAVALSGGVDSLTTAWLLKRRGYRVIGVHFVTGYEHGEYGSKDRHQSRTDSLLEAAKVTLAPIIERLNIPFRIFDSTQRFKSVVVDYFINAYRSGQTPNPCLVCNPAIKFGGLFAFARKLGAERLATGHYARLKREKDGQMHLFCGTDAKKDQSYFLARLTQLQLERVLFPLGEMNKIEVIALARKENLEPVTSGESQDICFIKNQTYKEFLARRGKVTSRPGPIVNTAGEVIGRHAGLHLFTIGQRRGINCPAQAPYYVVRIEPKYNRLVVGEEEALYTSTFHVEAINWIGSAPTKPIQAAVKIRYRHDPSPATVMPLNNRTAQVRFDHPQAAVTPGQGAVFYKGVEVLGGGWIVGPESKATGGR